MKLIYAWCSLIEKDSSYSNVYIVCNVSDTDLAGDHNSY